ncbi:MAG: hypothetical protein CFH39_02576, partial [Alphaproteobacteria bacterium MarineAlpha10_Bin2]
FKITWADAYTTTATAHTASPPHTLQVEIFSFRDVRF